MKMIQIAVGASLLVASLACADPVTNRTHAVGTNVVIRVGYLAEDVMQHPIVAGPPIEKGGGQFYFDIGDKPRSMKQIIVVYADKMKIPTERRRKIELKGTADHISFTGGKVRNSGYENEVFQLQSWRYVADKTSQPGGPANGSQPIRSETNSTSSAAGSRRGLLRYVPNQAVMINRGSRNGW